MFATHKLALLGILLLTAGCDSLAGLVDPLRGVETLDDVELASDAEAAQLITSDQSVVEEIAAEEAIVVAEPVAPTGLMGFFRRNVLGAVEAEEVVSPDETVEALDVPVEEAVEAEQGGLFGFLRASAPVTPDAEDHASSGGLLAMFTRSAPDEIPEAVPDTPLEFGLLRPACDVKRRALGTEIYETSGFRIYDTAAGETSLRMHYITGFDDGCPRAFLAALVLPGDVGTHEIVRYSSTRVRLEYSATDLAYEQIKGSFCRVGDGKPCGARLERLGNVTTFVSAYKTFGTGDTWAEFLLHDGAVAAVDLESL